MSEFDLFLADHLKKYVRFLIYSKILLQWVKNSLKHIIFKDDFILNPCLLRLVSVSLYLQFIVGYKPTCKGHFRDFRLIFLYLFIKTIRNMWIPFQQHRESIVQNFMHWATTPLECIDRINTIICHLLNVSLYTISFPLVGFGKKRSVWLFKR